MILVTVGTDLPFDRLVRVVDDWACETGRGDVFAQIGEGGWKPQHIRFANFLSPVEFTNYVISADAIVSHAGMGTILSALYHGKPILVMPKMSSLGEHRNEHQTSTARRMMEIGGVHAAFDIEELRCSLNRLDKLTAPQRIAKAANISLLDEIRAFIHSTSTSHSDASLGREHRQVSLLNNSMPPRFHSFDGCVRQINQTITTERSIACQSEE